MSDLERSGRSDETGNILIRYNEAHVRVFFFFWSKYKQIAIMQLDCHPSPPCSGVMEVCVGWEFCIENKQNQHKIIQTTIFAADLSSVTH